MGSLEFQKGLLFDELTSAPYTLKFWSHDRIQEACVIADKNYHTLADICRLNALTMITFAGSGHIGTSFSAAEIITFMKAISCHEDTKLKEFFNCQFFSSKGHDAPMLYAALHAFGEITDEEIFKFRRANGLEGHPTVKTSGVITNTGSLGMGISKAKGFVYANRLSKISRKVVVLLGDGELQEGQIWEAMPGAARDALHELVAIVDSNKIQSDTWLSHTLDLGNVKERVESVGWQFLECQGNSIDELSSALEKSISAKKPTWIQANTLKGAGVSFMEKFDSNGKFYKYHSGAPTEHEYEIAYKEILQRVLLNLGDTPTSKEKIEVEAVTYDDLPKHRTNSIVDVYASCLVELSTKRPNLFVMDADLSYDTGTYKFARTHPERYLQCGIAEQDMVSMAGTLALSSWVPIVHSFATFLSMRACEQIFNNATEDSTIVYVGFLAGVLPGMPGVSHQAVTDTIHMASNPNMRLFEPSNKREIELSLLRAVEEFGPSYIRMQSIGVAQSEPHEDLDIGTIWNLGEAAIIVCSGVSILEQAQKAVALLKLAELNVSLLTVFDINKLTNSEALSFISKHSLIVIIENSLPGNLLKAKITDEVLNKSENQSKIYSLGLNSLPICGQNEEVLEFHGLSADKIYQYILSKTKM